MEAEDVVHHRTPVMKERVTVMDLGMEVSMMDTAAASLAWCAAATTVSSTEPTTTPRMTAARDQAPPASLTQSALEESDSKSLVCMTA